MTGNGLPIEKIRVPVENLSDILLFMGIIVDDTRLQRIQEEFKAFLYISGDGWFFLQVRLRFYFEIFVCVYYYACIFRRLYLLPVSRKFLFEDIRCSLKRCSCFFNIHYTF